MISIFNKSRGFTLIEVMVVVVVISILSAIAIPAYQDYVIRSRIMEAISGLSAKQTQMEQCYQDNHTYQPTPPCKACVTETAENFEFTCTPSATTFTLTATGRNAMAGFVYTVNQSDARSTTNVPSGWSTSSTCWVTRKGGVC